MQRAWHDGTYTVLVAERRHSGRSDGATDPVWAGLVERHGGLEVGLTASGSAVAFRSAGQAVRCAVAIQEAQGTPSELSLAAPAGELTGSAGTEAAPVQQAARLA